MTIKLLISGKKKGFEEFFSYIQVDKLLMGSRGCGSSQEGNNKNDFAHKSKHLGNNYFKKYKLQSHFYVVEF